MKNFFCKNSNKGSTLITVIVVVAFISILATVMLYLSGENYKTKAIDLKTKESFYEAEEAVEFFRSQLIVDVANASADAYSTATTDYVVVGDKAVRDTLYLTDFRNNYHDIWENMWYDKDDLGAITGLNRAKGIATLFDLRNETSGEIDPSKVTFDGDNCSFSITIGGNVLNCTITGTSDPDPDIERFRYEGSLVEPATLLDDSHRINKYYINDLYVTVSDTRGYTAVIKTSFEITPPNPNFDSVTGVVSGESEEPSPRAISPEKYDRLDLAECVQYDNWTKE